jgi:hypothetical protein
VEFYRCFAFLAGLSVLAFRARPLNLRSNGLNISANVTLKAVASRFTTSKVGVCRPRSRSLR